MLREDVFHFLSILWKKMQIYVCLNDVSQEEWDKKPSYIHLIITTIKNLKEWIYTLIIGFGNVFEQQFILINNSDVTSGKLC